MIRRKLAFSPRILILSWAIAGPIALHAMYFDTCDDLKRRNAQHEAEVWGRSHDEKIKTFRRFLVAASTTKEWSTLPIHERMVVKTARDVVDIDTLLGLISQTEDQTTEQKLQAIINYRIKIGR